jgi:hypothetical protein
MSELHHTESTWLGRLFTEDMSESELYRTGSIGTRITRFVKEGALATHDWWLRGRIRILLLTALFGYDVNYHPIWAIIFGVLLTEYLIFAPRRWLVRLWVAWVLLAASFCVVTGSYF